ncbi:MAG: hypothetical protein J7574_03660 [Flavobacterium sp.]|nr:hypothetical protein [Flavobacterium sp.]MBO9583237.1 hypothetical protein [Flavobacterium sp.]
MKNSKLTLEDFQVEIISRKAKKTIKGGDEEKPEINEPKKLPGGGNT